MGSSQRTISMRSKEGSSDYRFPEPDLAPIEVSAEQLQQWLSELPEPQRRNDIVMKVSWGCLPTMPVF